MKDNLTESHSDSMNNIQYIGIDFGTYKCAMFRFDSEKGEANAIRNAEGEETTRSLVFYGEEEILVGAPALDMLDDPELSKNVITDVKLHLADSIRYSVPDEPTPVQVATEIFRKLKRDAEESGYFDSEITHAVVTHPVMFTQLEQDMLLQAIQDAGFREVHLLKEPEAAAIAFAKEGHLPGDRILIYDLGAGTFDLAVLVRDAKTGFYRSTQLIDGLRCGGNNFDRMLYGYCDKLFIDQHGRPLSMEKRTELRDLNYCRKKKENLYLSKSQSTLFSWSVPDREKKVIYFKHPVDRSTFEGLIQDMLRETIMHTQALFERARTSSYDVDTIVLIGGSSQIPMVDRLLQETLSIEPRPWHNRHLAVALGAAYCANDLWGAGYQLRQYRQAIEEAQEKGMWSEETNAHLASLCEKLALTDNQAEQIERDVLGITVNETMQGLRGPVIDEELQAKLDAFKIQAKAASRNTFTFLLVGRSGVGKSSSINSLMDKEVAKVGHHKPTTVEVEFYRNEAAGINYTVVDTPGLCDELEDKGNDETYLKLIRTKVPEIDCLWYVTKLNDSRISNDERRAIKLISAGCGEGIWKRAIIVFTYANAVHYSNTLPLLEQYHNACKERSQLIREEIAQWTSPSVADEVPDEVPFVAIDNLTRTTPDGKEWLGKLYTAVFMRISAHALLAFSLATDDRVIFGSRTSENTKDDHRYDGTGSIYVEDSEPLNKRLRRAMVDIFGESVVSTVSAAVSRTYDSVKSFFKGLFA